MVLSSLASDLMNVDEDCFRNGIHLRSYLPRSVMGGKKVPSSFLKYRFHEGMQLKAGLSGSFEFSRLIDHLGLNERRVDSKLAIDWFEGHLPCRFFIR